MVQSTGSGAHHQKWRHVGSVVEAPRLWSTGSVVVVHGLSCSAATKIRDQTLVFCTGRWNLYQ